MNNITKENRYQDGIRITKSVGEAGKTVVKVKFYFILCLVLIVVIVIGVIFVQLGWFAPSDIGTDADNGEHPNYEPNITPNSPVTPVFNLIVPNPTIDGIVELSWDEPVLLAWFKIWRQKDNENWEIIKSGIFRETSYTDTLTENGEYKYVMIAYIAIPFLDNWESDYSNVQTVSANIPIPPMNPSIIINDDGTIDGANATNSLDVTLKLYCDNADEMRFRIKDNYWTDYVDYTTTYPIILFEDDPETPNYRVGVEFKNQYGTIESWDGIIYDPESIPLDDEDGEEYYILAFSLILILSGLIGLGIYLRSRSKKTKMRGIVKRKY